MARIRRAPVEWPHWFYGPDGQSEIFNSPDEVPAGWTKGPNEMFVPPPPPVTYDRDELVKQLEEAGIPLNPTWGNAHMKKMLDDRSSAR